MRLCSIKDIEDGMVLGKSIFQSNNKLLLGAGYRITSQIKEKLSERGYTHIYVMEQGTDDITPEDVISDEIHIQAKAKLTDTVQKIEDSFQFQDLTLSKVRNVIEKGHLKNVTYDLRKIVEEILKDISEIGAKYLNTVMLKSKDTYFCDHAINITVMAIIVGKKYNFGREELTNLALGTFLHDIGKIIIEKVACEKGKDDYLYKEHPTFGYLLLNNDKSISPIETQIVNQHHENQDGSGFPIGLTGQNIPPTKNGSSRKKGSIFRLAEICCVVDAYDNLVLNPMQDKMLNPHEALKQLIVQAGTVYNKDIIKTLSQVIAVYPVGAYVQIVNMVDPSLIGCYGVVAKVNETDFTKPVIVITTNKYKKKTKPIMIDTSKLITVELKLII
ncbi:HD-GYP domain-containing protein [Candidatus Latescibacterota bacterium]